MCIAGLFVLDDEIDISGLSQSRKRLVFDIGSLYEYLEQIEDRREARGKRYKLIELLVLMLLAKLGGEDTPSGMAEWIAHRKEIWVGCQLIEKPKTASHMTYRRILQETISAEDFEKVLQEYHRQRLAMEGEIIITIDGKTVRGTIPYGAYRGTHLLAVYVPGQGLVLAQAEVDKKENEIVVAPKIVSQVILAGMIVIADAMHTQKSLSEQVVAANADYVWTVKGNQARTRWAIEKLFVTEGTYRTKNHHDQLPIERVHPMAHVAQVFRIERIIHHPHGKGKTREIVYGLTSLSPQKATPEKLLALFHEYWKIENGLHYRRDVTLHEDATRQTIGSAGHNMAILNNLVISLCLRNGYENLASARRFFDASPLQALNLLTSATL